MFIYLVLGSLCSFSFSCILFFLSKSVLRTFFAVLLRFSFTLILFISKRLVWFICEYRRHSHGLRFVKRFFPFILLNKMHHHQQQQHWLKTARFSKVHWSKIYQCNRKRRTNKSTAKSETKQRNNRIAPTIIKSNKYACVLYSLLYVHIRTLWSPWRSQHSDEKCMWHRRTSKIACIEQQRHRKAKQATNKVNMVGSSLSPHVVFISPSRSVCHVLRSNLDALPRISFWCRTLSHFTFFAHCAFAKGSHIYANEGWHTAFVCCACHYDTHKLRDNQSQNHLIDM